MNDVRDMEKQAARAKEIHEKAALAMPSISHLECECGERMDLEIADVERYLGEGWPQHCGSEMRIIPSEQSAAAGAEGDPSEMRIGTQDGKVTLVFPKPITTIGMTADQAFAMAKIIYKRAKKLQRAADASRIILPGRN